MAEGTTGTGGAGEQAWSFKVGVKGKNRVRVYLDPGHGVFAEYYEAQGEGLAPRRRRISLGQIARGEAEAKAREIAQAFDQLGAPQTEIVTLGRLFDIYDVEVTPTKSVGKQKHDRTCMEMFARFFLKELRGEERTRAAAALRRRGSKRFRWTEAVPFRPEEITYRHWQRFERERLAGRIGPAQARVVEANGQHRTRPVGPRQVQYDLQFLRAVLNWAAVSGLVGRNPVAGFKLPRNPSPAQPAIFEEEYQGMLEAVDGARVGRRKRGMNMQQANSEELVRRRLQLVLLNESGHRGQSVRHLRWSDVDMAGERLRWDARYDKQRKEHWTALSPTAVQELRAAQAALGAIGDALLFPSPRAPGRPMSRSLFGKWFKQAATAAGIARGRVGPHSMRRKAASELSPEDAKVAADALGMSVVTLLTIYRQSTLDRQREAHVGRKPLRMDGRPK